MTIFSPVLECNPIHLIVQQLIQHFTIFRDDLPCLRLCVLLVTCWHVRAFLMDMNSIYIGKTNQLSQRSFPTLKKFAKSMCHGQKSLDRIRWFILNGYCAACYRQNISCTNCKYSRQPVSNRSYPRCICWTTTPFNGSIQNFAKTRQIGN